MRTTCMKLIRGFNCGVEDGNEGVCGLNDGFLDTGKSAQSRIIAAQLAPISVGESVTSKALATTSDGMVDGVSTSEISVSRFLPAYRKFHIDVKMVSHGTIAWRLTGFYGHLDAA
ncbi:hypothetical protein Q3G72_019286 [Acer saccharum]|nr:hypothetical protein Q3G72_019286 [Acer saccharum]